MADKIEFTPDGTYNGTDSFEYTISDSSGAPATGTVSLTITPFNDPPVAQDDMGTTAEDTAVTIDVLANDSDAESSSLSVTIVSGPSSGGVVVEADNMVTYTPAGDFNGSDSFTYTVSDGQASDTGTVTVTINAVNDAPAAGNDAAVTNEDTAVGITLTATDVDLDSLTYVIVNGPSKGSLGGAAPNLTYTPSANVYGSDSFTFKANDEVLDSNIATVSITINAINVVQEVPPYTAYYAITETTSQGVVAGDMSLTSDDTDDTYEVITEEQSGNKNFTWYLLTHEWEFNILQGGDTVTFCVEAYQVGNEDYIFSYSLDGETYIDMLTVTKMVDDDQIQEYAMPAGLTGTVYVRVVDSNTAKGEAGPADSIMIDEISIRCMASVPEASNPSPGDAQIDVDPDVALSWTAGAGAVYHDVYLDTDLANLQPVSVQQTATTYDPSPTGTLNENTTYYWAVDEFDGTGALIAAGTAWTFTTGGACVPATMHVESIVLETVAADKGRKRGMATVTVYDNCGSPVAQAEVHGHFEGSFSDADAVLTDANGQAVFVTSVDGAIKKPVFDFVVDDIIHATLGYDASASASASTLSSK